MTMKKALLAAALLASSSLAAHAACNPTPPPPVPDPGNLVTFQCDSDNQATDADDLKLFLDKETGVTDIGGSLNKNSSITLFQNIHITADAAFNQEANGFAELHSADAGSPSNALHTVTFTPIIPSAVAQPGGGSLPFLGFDGFLGRGQVDPLGATGWDGDVFMDITFSGGATTTITFTGDTGHDDVGAIGFDELTEPGVFVTSVTMRLDATGAWNEVKQFDFSVPGSTAVPEPSTWAILLLGFAGLGYLGFRRSKKDSVAAVA
jgi:hypothetical protein